MKIPLTTILAAALTLILGAAEPRGQAPQTARPRAATDLTLADLFPTDRVLDVQITVEEQDWDTIRRQTRGFYSALQASRKLAPIEPPYTYVRAKVAIDGVEFPEVGLRKKGFIGSQSSTYPSLKIKLNHVDEKGGVEGLTKLTFNNNKQDTSLLSQFMGYALFNAAGSPAPRCAYAKITVNGEYLGIYSHVESVRQSMIKYRFGDDTGTLYEGTVVDFHEGWEGSFERKFGPDEPGRTKIKQLIEVLRSGDGSIAEFVDLDSFYTFWAVEGLLGFWDGYSGNHNNFFVYLNPKTGKFHFLPWGADSLFEKYSKLRRDPSAPISVKTNALVPHVLYQDKANRERYSKTLNALLDEHWNEKALLAEVDRIEAMLRPHLVSRHRYFDRALERVRDFIERRRTDIAEETSNGMPVWTRAPRPPAILRRNSRRGWRNTDTIWVAARQGDIDALTRHLRRGTKVNAKNETGDSPLTLAALAGRAKAVQFLIEKGADIHAKKQDGGTPLHNASFLGHVEIAKILIANGADVNAKNGKGETSLDVAAAAWTEELSGIVEFLGSWLRIELDPEVVKANRPKAAALLREHGGRSGKD